MADLYSGWLTHISGHPSAAGRAQDKESSPARDRRSTTEPRHQYQMCYTVTQQIFGVLAQNAHAEYFKCTFWMKHCLREYKTAFTETLKGSSIRLITVTCLCKLFQRGCFALLRGFLGLSLRVFPLALLLDGMLLLHGRQFLLDSRDDAPRRRPSENSFRCFFRVVGLETTHKHVPYPLITRKTLPSIDDLGRIPIDSQSMTSY